jgi:hypothetical protein
VLALFAVTTITKFSSDDSDPSIIYYKPCS